MVVVSILWYFFFQAEDGIRDGHVTGVQTCALPIFVGHRVRDVDGVGVGLLHHRDRQRWLTVGAGDRFDGCIDEFDVGDVGDLDRAVLAADDEVLDRVDGSDAGADLDRSRPVGALEFARRGGDAVGLEDPGYLDEVAGILQSNGVPTSPSSSPAEVGTPLDWRIPATSSRFAPSSSRSSRRMEISTCLVFVPAIWTWETPSMRLSSGSTISSRSAARWSSSASEVTDSASTGMSSVPIIITLGSTPSG